MKFAIRDHPVDYGMAALGVAAATIAGVALRPVFSIADDAMLFLIAIVAQGARARQGPALFAAVLSIIAFDYYFVPPFYTLAVADRRFLLTFTMMLAIAILTARLTAHLRAHADRAAETEIEVKTERLRTSLLSSLSHDLRTPLASIEGAASVLVEGADPAVVHALARTIVRESQRMTRLVANLLDMVRLEAGALHVHREWQPLEEVVGVALVFLEERTQAHRVTVSIPPDLPLVPIDALLIEQVLINLIENAVKYAPPGTAIELSALAATGSVTVTVADRGSGIPPGQEARIFEKFQRAVSDPSTAGVGLGLTICQGIIMAHGGRMWAENRDGGGAVFGFTLPIVGTPPVMPADTAASGAARG